MEKMRNMIRIKDVPSNTIEEAIIILKENKKAKKYECSSKFKNVETNCQEDKEYVVKEAELIISEYLKEHEEPNNNKKEKSIKRLKTANVLLIISLILSIIF